TLGCVISGRILKGGGRAPPPFDSVVVALTEYRRQLHSTSFEHITTPGPVAMSPSASPTYTSQVMSVAVCSAVARQPCPALAPPSSSVTRTPELAVKLSRAWSGL